MLRVFLFLSNLHASTLSVLPLLCCVYHVGQQLLHSAEKYLLLFVEPLPVEPLDEDVEKIRL